MRVLQLFWGILVICVAALPASGQSCSPFTPKHKHLSLNFTQLWICQGVSKLSVYPHVWTPLTLNLTCPTQDYSIYIGHDTPTALVDALDKHDKVLWCGLESLLTKPQTCAFSLTPYGTTYVGVITTGGGVCQLQHHTEFSYMKLALFVSGLLLFFNANELSASIGFRITAGGVLFTVTAVLIILFVVSRALPQKRVIITTLTAAGSVGWGLFRWLYGFWLPSLYDAAHNSVFLVYLVCSMLLGMAVTYYFDDTSNRKLNNILRTALQLAGLTAVCHGTTSFELSVAAVVLLLLTQLASPLLRFLSGTVDTVHTVGRTVAPLLTPVKTLLTPVKSMLTPVAKTRAVEEDHEDVEPRSPWHYKTPPPSRQQVEESLQHMGMSPLHMRLPPPTPEDVGRSLEGRLRVERLVRPQTSGTGQLSTSTAALAVAETAAAFGSPLPSGRIRNPITGRNIDIHGKVYEGLVQQGWSADLVRGVMTQLPDADKEATTSSPKSKPSRGSARGAKKSQ